MTANNTPIIRTATTAHLQAIREMIDAAYGKYIPRIGCPPAPMVTDYAPMIADGRVYVLLADGVAAGAIMLLPNGDEWQIENVVVDPACQGRGYGRLLMQFAEETAIRSGVHVLTLYTNEKMHENIVLYGRYGFTETGRRADGGFKRVFFRKTLR